MFFLMFLWAAFAAAGLIYSPWITHSTADTWEFWLIGVVLGLIVYFVHRHSYNRWKIGLIAWMLGLSAFVAAIIFFVRGPRIGGVGCLFITVMSIGALFLSDRVTTRAFIERVATEGIAIPFPCFNCKGTVTTAMDTCPHCGCSLADDETE